MSHVKITALGGVREFGKNMYVVEVDEVIFVLDAGLKYPETEMLGVDFVIPDLTYLLENADRVAGIFLTHGHPDSIGALPYLLAEVEVPVFGSQLTIELAKINVKGFDGSKKFDDFHIVDETTEIDFGTAVISFFSTTHTIPESLGIVVGTPDGNIVYTGDFKFDPAVGEGYKTNISRLAEISSQGVLALLSESANALSSVQSASEPEISDKIFDTIADWEGRVIIASTAANLARIQQVIDSAIKVGRHIAFTGHDLDQIVKTARALGKLRIDDDKMIIKPQEIKNFEDSELLILETGRMGEPLKTLADMATGRHRWVKIKDGDLVYTVTSPTIAYETVVAKTENIVYRAGGIMRMLSSELKVSGHANSRDLQFLLDILRPKNLVPVQGEYRELQAHAEHAMAVGMLPENIFLAKRGEVITFDDNGNLEPNGVVPAENVMIDGSGVGDIGNIVLRDRKILSEEGIFIAVITISKHDKKIISKTKVHTRGFVYVKNSRDLMKEAALKVDEKVTQYLAGDSFDWAEIKSEIRDVLGKFLFDQTKRRPVVLPVVMEVRQNDYRQKRHPKPKKKVSSN
ncbi:ribonuclease J [Lactococcus hodotermopsidis]|uniref:Ribonuclease J n=1 Tax=Pseudolactococcus hodotermopsidis TaxID=2709157 RepID=A0A6A0BD12_9LACT|nr:ribonuclease J [Lactococcus hodotermopsidis]GFH42271.1 ribonuclease J [Lactococcus hodotermopsidis]